MQLEWKESLELGSKMSWTSFEERNGFEAVRERWASAYPLTGVGGVGIGPGGVLSTVGGNLNYR